MKKIDLEHTDSF